MAAESAWRLGVFLTTFAVMALAEAAAPRRARTRPRLRRWPVNLGLTVLSTALVRLLAPVGVMGLAAHGQAHGWGLLPRLPADPRVAGLAAFVLLDLAVYLQHLLMHRVPLLWRLHRVHHCDEDMDATTAVRFHPVEMLVSLALKAAVVVAVGAPPAAVLVFEIVLNAAALFNHANWRLPAALDRVLRTVLVTPDMHRVHHSTQVEEQNTNFGFNLPWWDRLFGTYRGQPAGGHQLMRVGLADVPDPGSFAGVLRLPFGGRIS
ncbi:MAG: sterol desaturase family protein [Vicinamibacterales bacterium]|nr:sterol desaturase family protein [Vicinamibacterales bacterium]